MTLTMVRDTLRVLTVIFILPWTSFIVEKIFNKNLLATSTVMVIVMYVLFAGFWCGWLCPFGNLDFVITKLGDKIVPKAWRKSCVLPKKVHSYLGWLRYFFILPFVALAVSAGNIRVQQVSFWLIQLYFALKAFAILVIPLFMPRFFCKYICFHKALGNIINTCIPLWRLQRNEKACVSCGKCNKVCPMDIDIMHKKEVVGDDCIGCLSCCDVEEGCPKSRAAMELYFLHWKVQPKTLATVALLVYFTYYVIAVFVLR